MGKFVKGILGALLVGLPLAIVVLAGAVVFGSDSLPKDRYQAINADVLVPLLVAVLGTAFATAVTKGILGLADNAQRIAHQKDPVDIKLFDW